MITGYSIIQQRQVIQNGKTIFQDKEGSLSDFLLNAYNFFKVDYPKFYKMDNLSKAGFLAAELLMKQPMDHSRVALVLSNANSSLDTDLRYAQSAKTIASPALFVYTLPNIVAGEICIRHKIKGENAFFVNEKFDPELLASYVDSVPADICLAGWVDVLGEHHDVFLYLHDKKSETGLKHSAEVLGNLYNTDYGTIDGQS